LREKIRERLLTGGEKEKGGATRPGGNLDGKKSRTDQVERRRQNKARGSMVALSENKKKKKRTFPKPFQNRLEEGKAEKRPLEHESKKENPETLPLT